MIFREVLGAKDWSSFCRPGQTYPGWNIDSIVGFWMLTFLGDDRLLHPRGKCQFSQPQVFCFFVLVPFLKQLVVPSSVDEGEIVAARYSDESSFYRWTSAQPEDFRLKNLKWVNNWNALLKLHLGQGWSPSERTPMTWHGFWFENTFLQDLFIPLPPGRLLTWILLTLETQRRRVLERCVIPSHCLSWIHPFYPRCSAWKQNS